MKCQFPGCPRRAHAVPLPFSDRIAWTCYRHAYRAVLVRLRELIA